MSLHWRILGSNVVVIVLTVLIGVGVVYYGTESRLGGVRRPDWRRRSEPAGAESEPGVYG